MILLTNLCVSDLEAVLLFLILSQDLRILHLIFHFNESILFLVLIYQEKNVGFKVLNNLVVYHKMLFIQV